MPSESTRDKQGAGYTTIADLLLDFSKIGCLPRSLNLSRLDDGEGIEATLKQNKAKWHDSCRLRYNKTQLRRAEKRKRPIEVLRCPVNPHVTNKEPATRLLLISF